MKTTKKALSLFLALIMVFALSSTALAETPVSTIAAAPAASDIVILHTNDVHGSYKGSIGYAGLAAYRNKLLESTQYVTLVDAGDFSQGATIATLSKGEYLVDILNATGYDIVVPGNHEFDYGMAQALKNLGNLKAKVLSCNFKDLRTGESVYDAYTVVEYGDTKVAFVGISTPETYTKSTPTYFMDDAGNYIYTFCEDSYYATIQAAVDAADAEADYVVAVGHLGVDEQSAPWRSTDVIANTSGIDVFIDGHSHTQIKGESVKNKNGETVVLAQTGEKLANVGKITIKADGTISAELVNDCTEQDATVAAFIADIDSQYAAYTSQVVATSTVELNGVKAQVRTGETNLGDMIADAYRVVMGADVGIMNGGGIRASIPAGEVTIDNILAVMTFGNMATVVKATGQQILDCLEMGASAYPGASGGFTQVSNISYSIDTCVPSSVVKDEKGNFSSVAGEYRVKNVTIGGEPIDLNKTYTVACHSYWLTSYGDGMTMFKGCEIVEEKHEKIVDNAMLLQYIQENLKGVIGEEYAKPQGRIKFLDVSDKFTDVVNGAWYEAKIQYSYSNKLVVGRGDGTFGVNDKMTNAEFLNVLYRMGKAQGMTLPELATTGANWTEAASALYTLLTDTPATAEVLATPVTREQMVLYCTKLMDALGYTGTPDAERAAVVFTDAADFSSQQAAAAAQALYAVGGIDGYEDGSFKPQATARRCEAVTIFYNLLERVAA